MNNTPTPFDWVPDTSLTEVERTIEKTTTQPILPLNQIKTTTQPMHSFDFETNVTLPALLPTRQQSGLTVPKKLIKIRQPQRKTQFELDLIEFNKEKALFEVSKAAFQSQQQNTLDNLHLKEEKMKYAFKQYNDELTRDRMLFEQYKKTWEAQNKFQMMQSLSSVPLSRHLNSSSSSSQSPSFLQSQLGQIAPSILCLNSARSSEASCEVCEISSPLPLVENTSSIHNLAVLERIRQDDDLVVDSVEMADLNTSKQSNVKFGSIPNVSTTTANTTPFYQQCDVDCGKQFSHQNGYGGKNENDCIDQREQGQEKNLFQHLARIERDKTIVDGIDAKINRSLELLHTIKVLNKQIERKGLSCSRKEVKAQRKITQLKRLRSKILSYITFIKKMKHNRTLILSKSREIRRASRRVMFHKNRIRDLKETINSLYEKIASPSFLQSRLDQIALVTSVSMSSSVTRSPGDWLAKSGSAKLNQLEQDLVINRESWKNIPPFITHIFIQLKIDGKFYLVKKDSQNLGNLKLSFSSVMEETSNSVFSAIKGSSGRAAVFFSSPDVMGGAKIQFRGNRLAKQHSLNKMIFGERFGYPFEGLFRYPGNEQYCECCKTVSTGCIDIQHQSLHLPFFEIDIHW